MSWQYFEVGLRRELKDSQRNSYFGSFHYFALRGGVVTKVGIGSDYFLHFLMLICWVFQAKHHYLSEWDCVPAFAVLEDLALRLPTQLFRSLCKSPPTNSNCRDGNSNMRMQ